MNWLAMRRWWLETLLVLLTLAAALSATVTRSSITGQGAGTLGLAYGVGMSTTGFSGYDDAGRSVASGAFTAQPASGGTLAAASDRLSVAQPPLNASSGMREMPHCRYRRL